MLPFAAIPAQVEPCPSSASGSEREVLAMGTRLAFRLDGAGDKGRAGERGLEAVAALESLGSTWREDTEWARLNAAGGASLRLGAESFRLLERALVWQRETGGAFDPVLGALIEAWGLRRGGCTPSTSELARAREASGGRWLRLDSATGSARLGHPSARIEEGGFLKGAALDAFKEAAGAPSGLVDFGGQLLVWGPPRRIEVADPALRQRARLSLRLENASLSCSGCSERGRHILNPATGLPCEDWGAVAVVMPSAFDADVLSTALFVLGPERGPAWAESRGIAACFLPHQGPSRSTAAFQALHPVFLKESR